MRNPSSASHTRLTMVNRKNEIRAVPRAVVGPRVERRHLP